MTEAKNEIPLKFEGGGSFPVQYETSYMNNTYYVRYRSGYVTIEQNDIEVFEQALYPDELDGIWIDEETNVYLTLIAKAIVDNTLSTLKLPTIIEAPLNEFYKRGEYPKYIVSDCTKTHEHNTTCPTKTLAANELDEVSYNRIKKYNLDYRKKNSKRNH